MGSSPLTLHTEKAGRDQSARLRPLILDVEGALLRSDPLLESALDYIRPNPSRLLRVVWWLARSRSHLVNKLAGATEMKSMHLPVNEELVQFAAAAATQGRPVYAITARDARLIDGLARRLPFLSGIITSHGSSRPEGDAKAAVMASRFPDGFDYVGNAHAVLPLWRRAGNVVPADSVPPLQEVAAGISPIPTRIAAPSQFRALLKASRPHQWVKNLLVFVPIVLAGRLGDFSAVVSTVLAFLAIGIIASATYLINDMWDLVDDRAHWSKQHRPLASGRLLISRAAIVAPIAILIGLLVGMMASMQVVGVLLLYLLVTLSYTFGLKRIPLVDGLVLAALYTIRVALGIVAANVRPSPWLLVFSMFMFASLTYAKRYTEIARVIDRNGHLINGRGYCITDAPLLLAIGLATGIGAVLIMLLYIIEDAFVQTFYGNTIGLWGIPPLLLLLISRIWLKSHRGEMDDDPIEFVLRDRSSLALAALMAICFAFAWLGPNWN